MGILPSRDTGTSVYIDAGIACPGAALERQSRTLTQSRWFTRDRSPRNRKWLEQMKGTVLTLAGSRLTPWLAVFLSLRSVHAGGHGIGENGRILRTAPFLRLYLYLWPNLTDQFTLSLRNHAEKQQGINRLQTNILVKSGNVASERGNHHEEHKRHKSDNIGR